MPTLSIGRALLSCRLSLLACLVLAGVTRSAGAQSGDTLQTMNTGTVTLGVRKASGGFHVEMAERILKDIQKLYLRWKKALRSRSAGAGFKQP
jgi:hypothetical protein